MDICNPLLKIPLGHVIKVFFQTYGPWSTDSLKNAPASGLQATYGRKIKLTGPWPTNRGFEGEVKKGCLFLMN